MAEYISRRKFIGLGAGAAAGAGMLRLDPAWGEAPAIGNPLVEPELLESRRGRLRATLVLEKQRMVVAGREVEATVYNGSLPAPTLVAEPGDRIDLRLVNRLDEHTNIHTHGFHVRPDGNADNVFLHIAPGETFDYRFDIPRNHAPGLNWYHPHVHGHGTQHGRGTTIVRSIGSRRWRSCSRRKRSETSPRWRSRSSAARQGRS